ncbi:hypothetical protein HanXRQr2_Chr06g0244401 [Helianthus annuus]|uniref:Uncharacterized protein n=1 Tax=Helianthus annuus TaxID=4232 RepID=A0A9K3IQU3_HELAN|nr:hypothetical protein HanXRQr2_Chr06g0244401 [Helianthus annuus]
MFDELGAVCFFRGKTSAVCGPHLQTSAAEEVDQTSAVCKKKTVCFTEVFFNFFNLNYFLNMCISKLLR